MTIHVFIAHMGLGGAERVCINLCNEWAGRGHEVHMVTLNLDGDINTADLDASVKVHTLGVTRLRYAALPIAGYMREHKPEFMLVFGSEMAIIIQKLKKLGLTDTGLIVRVLNNVNITLAKEDGVSRIVENYLKSAQRKLRDMDHLIAQCEAMGRQLTDRGLASEDKLTVIYNPVSTGLIEKAERLYSDKKEHTPEVVFIGRIDPQKNPLELIRAFKKVADSVTDVRLRMVGDGVLREAAEAEAGALGISDRVIFDGIRTDMERVYADASVVALSSDYEGMPNCLIEAIGCGVPVVSYDCPMGPAEIVVEGVNGYLVPLGDMTALSERIMEALDRDWDRAKIRATCDKFRVEAIADRYLEIFKRYE